METALTRTGMLCTSRFGERSLMAIVGVGGRRGVGERNRLGKDCNNFAVHP